MSRSIATSVNCEIAAAVSSAQRASELIPHRTLSSPSGAAPTSSCASWCRWGRLIFSEAVHSDGASNVLIHLGANFAVWSEFPLKSLRNRADFDSTMRRFESSRPGQYLANEIRCFLNLLAFYSDVRPMPGIFPAATSDKRVKSCITPPLSGS